MRRFFKVVNTGPNQQENWTPQTGIHVAKALAYQATAAAKRGSCGSTWSDFSLVPPDGLAVNRHTK
jgi:hypothetical protein